MSLRQTQKYVKRTFQNINLSSFVHLSNKFNKNIIRNDCVNFYHAPRIINPNSLDPSSNRINNFPFSHFSSSKSPPFFSKHTETKSPISFSQRNFSFSSSSSSEPSEKPFTEPNQGGYSSLESTEPNSNTSSSASIITEHLSMSTNTHNLPPDAHSHSHDALMHNSSLSKIEIENDFANSNLTTTGVELVTSVSQDWSFWATPALYIIRGLNYAHDLTDIPWWLVITGYTVMMRLCLTPLTLLQAKSTANLSLLSHKLPRILSPNSNSFKEVFKNLKFFLQKKKELNGPSLWFVFTPPLIQLPVFLFSIFAIRYMAFSNFPGFENGGILWFKDLSSLPHGNLGLIIPFSIAITYLINIQINFHGMKHTVYYLQTFFMFCKWVLQFLTLPILLTTLNLPQGVHFYWLTNNIGNIILTILLKSDHFRSLFNIPTFKEMQKIGKNNEINKNKNIQNLKQKINDMGVDELMNLAAQSRVEKNYDESILLLKIVLEKDKSYSPAYNALGQLYFEKSLWMEASVYFSKYLSFKSDDSDLNISVYRSYGIALANQGRVKEAISVLLELNNFFPSENNQFSKLHFSQGLISLASLLQKEGKIEEAIFWLKKAAKIEKKIEFLYIKPLQEILKSKK